MIGSVTTIYAAAALVQLVFTAVHGLMARSFPGEPAFRWWSVASFTGALTAISYAIAWWLQNQQWIHWAPVPLLFSHLLMWAGLLVFQRRPVPVRWFAGFAATYLAIKGGLTVAGASPWIDAAIICGLVAVLSAAFALDCAREARTSQVVSMWVLAVMVGVHAGFFLLAVVLVLIGGGGDMHAAGSAEIALFTTFESIFLVLLMNVCFLTMFSERLHSSLDRLASEDALTGLLNRRAFFARAGEALAGAQALGKPACAVVFDVDHFKAVNDRHGHAIGDATLRALGETAVALVREQDVLGRLGGEEFGLVLIGADLQEAEQVAQRLRVAIAGTAIPTDGPALFVTVSMGVAQARENQSLADLLVLADRMLYDAKHSGRDQVRVALPVCDTANELEWSVPAAASIIPLRL